MCIVNKDAIKDINDEVRMQCQQNDPPAEYRTPPRTMVSDAARHGREYKKIECIP
jgi:hypothetical protein